MKTDTVLFVVMIIAVIGVIFFSLKPKVCVDPATGQSRTTYKIFPCKSGEMALTDAQVAAIQAGGSIG